MMDVLVIEFIDTAFQDAVNSPAVCFAITRALIRDPDANCSSSVHLSSYTATTVPGDATSLSGVRVHTVHEERFFSDAVRAEFDDVLRSSGFYSDAKSRVVLIEWERGCDVQVIAGWVIIVILAMLVVASACKERRGQKHSAYASVPQGP